MKPAKSEIIEVLLDHIQTVRNSYVDVRTRKLPAKAIDEIECLKAAIRSVMLAHGKPKRRFLGGNPPLA